MKMELTELQMETDFQLSPGHAGIPDADGIPPEKDSFI
jgi:hypothetical protein